VHDDGLRGDVDNLGFGVDDLSSSSVHRLDLVVGSRGEGREDGEGGGVSHTEDWLDDERFFKRFK